MLASIAVLIYFIHHVPQRIHINSVIKEAGERLLCEVDDRFPAFVGHPAEDTDEDRLPAAFRDTSAAAAERLVQVRSKTTGYIQVVDHGADRDGARARPDRPPALPARRLRPHWQRAGLSMAGGARRR